MHIVCAKNPFGVEIVEHKETETREAIMSGQQLARANYNHEHQEKTIFLKTNIRLKNALPI